MSAARFDAAVLHDFAAAAFGAVGMRAADADVLASSLVQADATGVSTHGLNRLDPYLTQLQEGQVTASPDEQVVTEGPTSLLVDAGRGFGAPVGLRTVDTLMTKAREVGVALAGVRNVAHFGTAGFYTRHAADAGFLALAASSSSPSVVPFGGRTPRIGNSPMSFAAPGLSGPELVMDMAQSTTSRGRIKLALDNGEPIAEGWAVDADGVPTTDPAAALAGGVLTSGGHKGSALSLMVEMLASGLSGANLVRDINHAGFTSAPGRGSAADVDVTVGNFYLVVDADLFSAGDAVRASASAIAEHVRGSEPAPGVERVLAPGDPETLALARSRSEGVPLSERTLASLHGVAERLGVPLDLQTAQPDEEN